MASDKKLGCSITESDLDFLKLQYQVLSERRINHNTLLWNVPSMLFVAQAFLWTIAVNNDNNVIIRFPVSLLSIVISYISYQQFERNRVMEVVDSEQMYSIETFFQTQKGKEKSNQTMIIHHKLSMRTLICGKYKFISEFLDNHPDYGEEKAEEEETVEKSSNEKKSSKLWKKAFSKLWKKESSKLWRIVFIFFFILSLVIALYNFKGFWECIYTFIANLLHLFHRVVKGIGSLF